MKRELPRTEQLTVLLNTWNSATCPWEPRTDHEHARNRQLARATMNRMKRMGFRDGVHYRELSNGMLWTVGGAR